MKTSLNLFYTLCIFTACLLCSCVNLPNYGALGPAGGNGEVSIDDLKAGWEDYDIYYNTWYTASPAALMFDPRGNDTTLTGNSWTIVKEQAVFSQYIEKLAPSRLWAIVGPEKQVLGYMITPTTQLYIKKIDDKTYYVSNLQVPPSGP
jgi:hypothetical protein